MYQEILLPDTEATVLAGKLLGEFLQEKPQIRVLLFYGELGAGKTTFTRGFVSAYQNAEHAEVSSPTFTLVNIYPTKPKIYHADAYRLAELRDITKKNFVELPEEIDLALEDKTSLILIEWAEHINVLSMPQERLDIYLKTCKNTRSLHIKAHTVEGNNLILNYMKELTEAF